MHVMVERFIESSNAPLTTDYVSQAMKNAFTSAGSDKEETLELTSNIESFKAAFTKSNFFDKLKEFVDNLSSKDPTWKFWSQFVFKDALAYVAFFLAIPSGDWDLKMASVKLMAPIFSAYDHSNYSKLIARHISDVLSLPTSILSSFKEGCFVVSFTGKAWHSVGIDQAHEMGINKDRKTCIVRPTKDYINRIANYIPYRSKCLKNLQRQFFLEDDENNNKSTPKSYTSKISSDKISNSNIQV